MALTKCPECGRENVSDQAEICPNCGYGIKGHFDKIKQEEEAKRILEEKRNREIEKQNKDLAEKKRLAEILKKEQEEKEIRESKLRLERQKKAKYLMLLLAVVTLIMIITVIFINTSNSKKKEALQELANNSFQPDFETFIKSLNGYGIDIDGKYEFKDMTYDDGVLSIVCNVRCTSEAIDDYKNATYDSITAKRLCFILKDIYNVKEENKFYSYGYDEGEVKIELTAGYNGIFVYGKNDCEYNYSYSAGWDNLEIAGETVYMKSDAVTNPSSTESSSSSYSGSYDATLKYGSEKVLVCISKDAMDRYLGALNNSNQGTIDEMETSGEIGWTAQGTKCNIVDRGIGTYQVKLLDGAYEGNTVYVITESVNEK